MREDLKQPSERDSCMIQMLELADREFKITIINMSRALMEEVDNMQEQTCNVENGNSKKESQRNTRHKKYC